MNEMVADAVDMPSNAPASAPAVTSESPAAKATPERPVDLDAPRYADGDPRKENEGPPVSLKELREASKPDEAPPPIKPPKFWSDEGKAKFAELPRELQEFVATREREADKAIGKRFDEAAETKRQVEADRAAAQQLRQQQETIIFEALHAVAPALAELGIRTEQDWKQYAAANPEQATAIVGRVERLQAQARELAQRRQAEQQQAYAAQVEQHQKQFSEWAAAEDAEFLKNNPDFKDPEKASALSDRAIKYLTKTLGISRDEVAQLWNTNPLIRGSRGQQVILDAMLWREAQAKAKAATPKQQPKPQSPGTGHGPLGGSGSELARRHRAGRRGKSRTRSGLSASASSRPGCGSRPTTR
jgi:hypothetical protein